MAMPPRRALLLAAATAPLLSACGFQLRRAPEFAFRRIALAMPASSLAVELRRQLEGTCRLEIVADQSKAEVVLESPGE